MPGCIQEQGWAETAPAETVRVLLVEDNPGDDRLVRLALSEDPCRKFEVTSARTLGEGLELAQTLPLEVQVIRLGRETAIVTLPGEVFVELGLAIKSASPFETTLVIELANECPVPLLLVRDAAWSDPPRFAAAVDVADAENVLIARGILQAAGFLASGCRANLDILYCERERQDQLASVERSDRLAQLGRPLDVPGGGVTARQLRGATAAEPGPRMSDSSEARPLSGVPRGSGGADDRSGRTGGPLRPDLSSGQPPGEEK